MTNRLNKTNTTILLLALAALVALASPVIAQDEQGEPTSAPSGTCTDPCVVTGIEPQVTLDDTSVGSDWELELSIGGDEFRIGVDGLTSEPFRIEEGASNLLYLDAFERVGINTFTPTEELQIESTLPGIRLNDTSIGAGQADIHVSTDFLVFEGTSGADVIQMSTDSPFAMRIHNTGDVSVGSSGTADATFHVTDTDPNIHERVIGRLTGSSFSPQFEYENGTSGQIWREGMNPSGHFVINEMTDPGVAEMRISPAGQVFVNGTQVHPDYVFEEDYELMPLSELESFVRENRHLPGVVSSEEAGGKVDLSSFPLQLLEKVEELSLYTIQQERTIQALKVNKDARIAQLEERLAALEALLEDRATLE